MSFWTNDQKEKTCPRCKGVGEVTIMGSRFRCPVCGGKGKVDDN